MYHETPPIRRTCTTGGCRTFEVDFFHIQKRAAMASVDEDLKSIQLYISRAQDSVPY
jgi:hypothetical protein